MHYYLWCLPTDIVKELVNYLPHDTLEVITRFLPQLTENYWKTKIVEKFGDMRSYRDMYFMIEKSKKEEDSQAILAMAALFNLTLPTNWTSKYINGNSINLLIKYGTFEVVTKMMDHGTLNNSNVIDYLEAMIIENRLDLFKYYFDKCIGMLSIKNVKEVLLYVANKNNITAMHIVISAIITIGLSIKFRKSVVEGVLQSVITKDIVVVHLLIAFGANPMICKKNFHINDLCKTNNLPHFSQK